jgi:glycogen debranching enzyme
MRASEGACTLRFDFRDEGLRWTTLIQPSIPGLIQGKDLRYRILLSPRETWLLQIVIDPYLTERVKAETSLDRLPELQNWPPGIPEQVSARLESSFAPLARAHDQALKDLRALRVAQPSGLTVPAAGLPWFMAVFGRDSLITALQTLVIDQSLAYGALRALAAYQATENDTFRDAEPGKIPHEIRHGRLSHGGKVPHSRYYGTVDATPLFLITLAETTRWTNDLELARELLPAAEAALAWIEHHADLDGDGFVEYSRRSRQGLQNQGWKDSHDSVNFADGRPADGPIALCEVQGYVYRAHLGMAWLYRMLNQSASAKDQAMKAAELKRRFNKHFWIEDRKIIAMALDGDKRPVDTVTSNMGQCLWTGVVDRDKAAYVASRLMAEDMYSGWGVRTLSTAMSTYNPISYHNGSV